MSETRKRPDRGSPPGTPRWVKVFIVIFIALILLVVALHLMGFGMGSHGLETIGSRLPRLHDMWVL